MDIFKDKYHKFFDIDMVKVETKEEDNAKEAIEKRLKLYHDLPF